MTIAALTKSYTFTANTVAKAAEVNADFDELVSKVNEVIVDVNLAAPKASPTFTGTVALPTNITINGTALAPTVTELNYVDGVTSAIQTQLDAKAPLASPSFTGSLTHTSSSDDFRSIRTYVSEITTIFNGGFQAYMGSNTGASVNVKAGGTLELSGPTIKLNGKLYKYNSTFDTPPSSATDTGTKGEIRICEDAIYVCTATNTWKRAALSTWS